MQKNQELLIRILIYHGVGRAIAQAARAYVSSLQALLASLAYQYCFKEPADADRETEKN